MAVEFTTPFDSYSFEPNSLLIKITTVTLYDLMKIITPIKYL
jgi:hypothetical protein